MARKLTVISSGANICTISLGSLFVRNYVAAPAAPSLADGRRTWERVTNDIPIHVSRDRGRATASTRPAGPQSSAPGTTEPTSQNVFASFSSVLCLSSFLNLETGGSWVQFKKPPRRTRGESRGQAIFPRQMCCKYRDNQREKGTFVATAKRVGIKGGGVKSVAQHAKARASPRMLSSKRWQEAPSNASREASRSFRRAHSRHGQVRR